MKKIDSFVYCWTDHKNKKLYVGVHKGSLTDGYICSSKNMKEQYNSRPEDFTRQIVAEGNYQDMVVLEAAILRSVNAKLNENFYNAHNGDGKFYNKGHTEETKKKLSGLGHTEETRDKLRQLRLNQTDPRLGKKHTVESKLKIGQGKKGQQCHVKTVTIEGITYNSYKDAAAALGCNYNTITRRIKRGMYV